MVFPLLACVIYGDDIFSVGVICFDQQHILAVCKIERSERNAVRALRNGLVQVGDADALCVEDENLSSGRLIAVQENGLLLCIPCGSQIPRIHSDDGIFALGTAASFFLLTRAAGFRLFARATSFRLLTGAACFDLLAGAASISLLARTAGFGLDARTAYISLLARTAGFSLCTRTADLGLDARTACISLLARTAGFSLCTRTADLGLLARTADLGLDARTANLGLDARTADLGLGARTADLGLDAGAAHARVAFGESFGIEGTCKNRNLGNLLNKKNLFRLIFHDDSEESCFSCKRRDCAEHC